jgi:hypothetical protein
MVLVRNVFRLKFGKAKEGVAVLKEGMGVFKKLGGNANSIRILTDLTGPFYTVVLEMAHDDLAASEAAARKIMSNPEWQANYSKFVPLVESGYREIFNVVEAPVGAGV